MTPQEIAKAIRAGGYIDMMKNIHSDDLQAFYEAFPLSDIDDTFGFELEFISNTPRSNVAHLIQTAGIQCQETSYNQGYTGSTYIVKSDGSLRLSSSEAEFLTRVEYLNSPETYYRCELVSPILTNLTLNSISRVMSVLGSRANPSSQRTSIPLAYFNKTCSLHVHMSVENYTQAQKKSIFYTYAAIEEELKNIIADKRIYTDHGRKYAKSVQGMTYEAAMEYGKRLSLRVNSSVVNENDEPITFEYRKMNATRSSWVLKNWIYILAAIHRYGAANRVKLNSSVDLYEVIKSPILQDFFHKRRAFMGDLKSPTPKEEKREPKKVRPRRITIGSLL